MKMGSEAPNPADSLGAGSFGITKKPVLSGSSDTRSTPENELKIPERLFPACHQLWGHSSAQRSLSRADKLDKVAIRILDRHQPRSGAHLHRRFPQGWNAGFLKPRQDLVDVYPEEATTKSFR
jgi:hypothetical protein